MSPGLQNLMWKAVLCQSLNTYDTQELKYAYTVLCHMYNTCFNIYTFREALCNTGCRDDTVLGRKVPIEIWMIIYDGIKKMGATMDMLATEDGRASLWLHFNSNPHLLEGLTQYIFSKIGLKHRAVAYPQNITDGNYLYNMASVIPNRLLMCIGYCLVFWGKKQNEYWVRTFFRKIFILYLIISGYLIPKKNFMIDSIHTGYTGPIEVICNDLMATRGLVIAEDNKEKDKLIDGSLEYVFIFNNNVMF